MDTDEEADEVAVVDGLGMGLSEISPHGKDLDGSMDPVHAGHLDMGEVLESGLHLRVK